MEQSEALTSCLVGSIYKALVTLAKMRERYCQRILNSFFPCLVNWKMGSRERKWAQFILTALMHLLCGEKTQSKEIRGGSCKNVHSS